MRALGSWRRGSSLSTCRRSARRASRTATSRRTRCRTDARRLLAASDARPPTLGEHSKPKRRTLGPRGRRAPFWYLAPEEGLVNPGCPKIAGHPSDSWGVRPHERRELRWIRVAPDAKEEGVQRTPSSLVPEEGLVNPGRAARGWGVRCLGRRELHGIEAAPRAPKDRGP